MLFVHWIASIGLPVLKVEHQVLTFCFGEMTKEETKRYVETGITWFIMDLFYAAEATVTLDDHSPVLPIVCYFFVLQTQSVLLDRCNNLAVKLNCIGNIEKVKSLDKDGVSCFLFLDCCLGASSLDLFLKTGRPIYFSYTLRYLLMAAELVYFKVWFWNALREVKLRFLGDDNDQVKALHRNEKIIRWVWFSFDVCLRLCNTLISGHVLYLVFGVLRGYGIATDPPRFFFGAQYSTSWSYHDHLSVGAVGPQRITDDNNMCIICLEETYLTDACDCCLAGNDPAQLFCGHFFHYHCLMEWFTFREACPICGSTGFDEYMKELFSKKKHPVPAEPMFTEVSDTAFQVKPNETHLIYVKFAESSDTDHSSDDL